MINNTVRIIDTGPHNKPGQILISHPASLTGHVSRIYACEFDGVRRLVTIDTNENLFIWDVRKYVGLVRVVALRVR